MGLFGGDSSSTTTNRYRTTNISTQLAAQAKSIVGTGNTIIATDQGAIAGGVALGEAGLDSASGISLHALDLGGHVVDTLATSEGQTADVLGAALEHAQATADRSLGYAANSSQAALSFAASAAQAARPESATMTRDAMIAAVALVGLAIWGRAGA